MHSILRLNNLNIELYLKKKGSNTFYEVVVIGIWKTKPKSTSAILCGYAIQETSNKSKPRDIQ